MTERIVVVGCSWGGLHALGTLFGSVPPDVCPPIVVAQHRHVTSSGEVLSRVLENVGPFPVKEVEDKDELEGARVFIAPPDYHLLVERGHLALSTDEPVGYARPSIDVLFESAAASYGEGVVAVVLTGAGKDGVSGGVAVKDAGGVLFVQDPGTAERAELPRAVIATGRADAVLPVARIGARVARLCGSSQEASSA